MNNGYISSLLKKLRTDLGYSCKMVADILNVSKSSVSKWENGDDIKTEHLYELAKLYNVSFSELHNGKLNDDWSRKYDLSYYNMYETKKMFFEHCTMVKKRFFELLPQWASNKLNENEIEEFEYIKNYFKFDLEHYSRLRNESEYVSHLTEEEERHFVIETIERIMNLDEKSYEWELSKLYDFDFNGFDTDFDILSDDIDAFKSLIVSHDQIGKDSLLYIYLCGNENRWNMESANKERTIEKLEKIPQVKILIDSGANVLYQNKQVPSILNEELFKRIDGKIVEVDESVYDKRIKDNNGNYVFMPILSNWKVYSYNDYLEFIDFKETEHLRDVFNLKDREPIKYYENMLRRDGING